MTRAKLCANCGHNKGVHRIEYYDQRCVEHEIRQDGWHQCPCDNYVELVYR